MAFTKLSVGGAKFSTAGHFVPNCHQFSHLDCLTVTEEIAAMIEEDTQEQFECPVWKEIHPLQVSVSRFYERGDSSGLALAARILQEIQTSNKNGPWTWTSGAGTILTIQCKMCHPVALSYILMLTLVLAQMQRFFHLVATSSFGPAENKCPDICDRDRKCQMYEWPGKTEKKIIIK